MPICSPYSNPCDLNIGLHGMRIPVMSSLGIGPRGHDISVDTVEGEDGSYRLQFKDSVTGEVLNTTPNLDMGSRLYVCNQNLSYASGRSYTVNISSFADTSSLAANDIRIDDVVIYEATTVPGGDVDVIGVGIVSSVSDDIVSFTSTIEMNTGSVISSRVEDWLDSHPEATTTVEDGSITARKLDPSLPSIAITNAEIDEIMSN